MRALAALLLLTACTTPKPQPAQPGDAATATPATPATPAEPSRPAESPPEQLAADTPKTTTAGNTFLAPVGWSLTVRGPATILEAPEGGSYIALVDLAEPKDVDAAVAAAFAAYKPDLAKRPLKVKTPAADRDGWADRWSYDYQISPNEQRGLGVNVRRANGVWTVAILDVADAVAEKRGAQLGLVFGKLLPKGRERESFAGKRAHPLDAARVAALGKFVEDAQALTGVPGVAVGLVQNGEVVFAGGYGVRELGKPAKVDGDTKFMIASNTKALATLMLAKLVDQKKLTWDTAAASLLPSFKLGDAATTARVQVKHLICACTGLPRQDMEWLFQWQGVMPADVMNLLGTMQPTSGFGELFQYSNPLAAAAGFIGGHVAYPQLELGAAYDKAMQTLVFTPLGMKVTTHDFVKGQKGNVAAPHAPDIDGKPARAIGEVNTSVIPVRPAGGAWSSVRDVLKYVQMELDNGALPGGKPYISKDVLLARRAPQVAVGTDATYGMGLMVDRTWGVEVVHHGGDMIGYHSDMMWLPEHGVGAVILTNGDPGWQIRGLFQRKLLEVLFDGRPEADAQMVSSAKGFFDSLAAERKLYTVPADPAEVGKLAARYTNAALGDIAVKKQGAATIFDFGEYASEVATRKNPDGTHSFITTVPGMNGLEFVVGGANGKRTLTIRDPQHEYVFTAQ
jgi:CubicO group peptidase (beta-lactamase class C family)